MRRAHTPLWRFAVAAMPYGSFNGAVAVALPYLLRRQGLSVERIAAIAAFVQAPAIWYVLWAPIVDFRFRRRSWLVGLSLTTAICAALAFSQTTRQSIRSATVLLVLGSVFCQPVSSAVGGLVASVVPNADQDRAAGWSQTGILGAAVISSAVAVVLIDRGWIAIAALAIGVLIALPSFAALTVDEPAPRSTRTLMHLRSIATEMVRAATRRANWLGIILFISPVGAGALMNLFSSVAPEFNASSTIVIAVVAVAGAFTAGGALAGGYLLDHVDRWYAYPICGLLTALVAAGMLVAPLSASTYLVGGAMYALITGFAYAAYMALALELVGSVRTANSTLFTLFTAAVNVPVVYMLRLDGAGHARFGVRGMLAADGAANGVAAILLLALVTRFRPRLHDT
jgi:PAT family beta-lactamase induction signal transducer AmpG